MRDIIVRQLFRKRKDAMTVREKKTLLKKTNQMRGKFVLLRVSEIALMQRRQERQAN